MVRFEGYERRIDGINKAMAEYGIASLEDAKAICDAKGVDVAGIVKGVQPIAFENADIVLVTKKIAIKLFNFLKDIFMLLNVIRITLLLCLIKF